MGNGDITVIIPTIEVLEKQFSKLDWDKDEQIQLDNFIGEIDNIIETSLI